MQDDLKGKLYKHICQHYHAYSVVANVMIALSLAGFALLGILTTTLTATVLIAWGVLFAIVYGVGKLIDQEVDDLEKVAAHNYHETPERCKANERNTDSDGDNISDSPLL